MANINNVNADTLQEYIELVKTAFQGDLAPGTTWNKFLRVSKTVREIHDPEFHSLSNLRLQTEIYDAFKKALESDQDQESMEDVQDSTVPQQIAPEVYEAAAQQQAAMGDDPVHEAANGAHQGPPVANIDDLEDQIENAAWENRYSMLMARLRIVQASAIDPRQIAQAVQAAQGRTQTSLDELVNEQRPPPRIPRAHDAVRQAAAMARVTARFAAVGL
jgi:hypothetical protein